MSTPTAVLRGDLTGSAFTAAAVWTDYTTYLELGDDGAPIDITWGTGDERQDVTPTTFSFVLNNDDGRFTTGASIITTAHRFNVQVIVGGTTYDRCTGFVENVEVLWPGGLQTFCTVKVTCSDISQRLAEALPLRSMVEHEILADSPRAFYPLTEANPAQSAGDIGPNRCDPAVRLDSKYGANPFAFGTTVNGLLDELTGVQFGADGGSATGPATVLRLPTAALVPSSGAHTVEAWVVTPSSNPSRSIFVVDQGSTTTTDRCTLFINSSGIPVFNVSNSAGTSILTGGSSTTTICDGRLHHLVGTTSAAGTTATLYVDGVQVDSDTSGSSSIPTCTDGFIGGLLRYGANAGGGNFPGTVALVATYGSALSAARVLVHYQAGVGTLSERSDLRFTRLLSYASLTTSGLPTGQATMGGQRTSGRQLLEALKQLADTEGTRTFVTPAGNLTFQARNIRYWPTSSFTLTADDLSEDFPVRKDRQGLVNDQTATREGGAEQRVQNTTSISAYGRRDGGSLDVAPSTDYDALQNAAWRVQTGKDPQTRSPSLPIDLRAQPTTALAQSIMGATVSTAITLSGLPSQTPGGTTMSLFIEGAREALGARTWGIEFFNSPLSASGSSFTSGTSTPTLPNTLRADSSASERTKLDAGLKIPF